MKHIHITLMIVLVYLNVQAQTPKPLTLDECFTLARQNYPLVKQKELILKSKEYSLQNASKGYLPQFSINGQATYQSDVTQVPIKLPNVEIPTISKDQYKIYGEATQVIFDGGIIKTQKQSVNENADIEEQKLEVEIYKLKERISQLYFGILMNNEQLIQTEILEKDLQSGINKTNAAIANGTALKTSADVLQVELLKAGERKTEIKSSRKAFLEMLGLFLNQTLNENTVLEKPATILASQTINRPELVLFENQKKQLDVQRKLIQTKNLPKLNLFVQGGYGRPGLNMLNNDFDSYYLGGIRLNWNLSGLYTTKKEKAIVEINRNIIDLQKETFLFNTNFSLKQQNSDISKLQELIKTDEEILTLRTRIKNTASAQLENGVITSNDYVREVNAEDQARQNQLLHEIQLLMAEYSQQITTGN